MIRIDDKLQFFGSTIANSEGDELTASVWGISLGKALARTDFPLLLITINNLFRIFIPDVPVLFNFYLKVKE